MNTALKVMKRITSALDKADLHPYLLCQPLGFMCPEVEESPVGYVSLPEFPFGACPKQANTIAKALGFKSIQ